MLKTSYKHGVHPPEGIPAALESRVSFARYGVTVANGGNESEPGERNNRSVAPRTSHWRNRIQMNNIRQNDLRPTDGRYLNAFAARNWQNGFPPNEIAIGIICGSCPTSFAYRANTARNLECTDIIIRLARNVAGGYSRDPSDGIRTVRRAAQPQLVGCLPGERCRCWGCSVRFSATMH